MSFEAAVMDREADPSLRSCWSGGETESAGKDLLNRPGLSFRREMLYSVLGLVVTLAASVLLVRDVADRAAVFWRAGAARGVAEQVLFGGIALLLVYGNLVYQLARWGYLQRLRGHRPADPARLERFFEGVAPSMTILLPSYKEDPEVVRRSVLSAALQDYPAKRVVLLIDDPPDPAAAEDRTALDAARRLSAEVQAMLSGPDADVAAAAEAFASRRAAGPLDSRAELAALAEVHDRVAAWFEHQARHHRGITHSDRLFVRLTYLEPWSEHQRRAEEFRRLARQGGPAPDAGALARAYRRLAGRFASEISHFERKRYANLSHESNKAMNLNSYIALLGRRVAEVKRADGLCLEPAAPGQPALAVPDADFLITLDADSLLAPQYALRLIEVATRTGHERMAVVQTPYSAEPEPPGVLERAAGATTDMQYLVHQGFTRWGATFWVGANALLRVRALRDIAVEERERGHRVHRFIQDRTVIEDTESSLDLAARGWTLHNYPERLSFSATPADMGALLIQRRRWSNGGLIILPKLLRHLFGGVRRRGRLREGFFRLHYLVSPAAVNLSLPVLLLVPFEENLRNVWFPLTCLPYFLLYGRDLLQAGYRVADLFRVYAMNLMLVPINLGGVFKSIQQGITRRKIPFSRTPKMAGRTASPAGYLLAVHVLLAFALTGGVVDAILGRWLHAAFSLANGAFLLYAAAVFMRFADTWEDVAGQAPHLRSLGGWLAGFRPASLSRPSPAT